MYYLPKSLAFSFTVDKQSRLATSGIPDCPRVFPRGRRFCCRRLMPEDLASKAAARVTSSLAS